jgi:anti-anti-sigma regulatory factor
VRYLSTSLRPASSLLALATLGIVNTGVAYWLFYLLIDEAATASVITYVMPVVALILGVGLPGIRLAGEIDHRNAEPLALALAEAIRLEGDITVNMAGLAFIDVSCARMILDAARGLAGSRAVVLSCREPIAARFVLLGAADVPGLSVVSGDDW